jgi:methionyl-tRNA synthetase
MNRLNTLPGVTPPMPECERCETELDAKAGGLRDALGLASYGGYECDGCGLLLCSSCYNERTVELAGAAPDSCPHCDGRLQKR